MLRARGLRLDLPGREPVELDLKVGAGEAVQLCGPSGCGKTTLLRILARLEERGPSELTLGGAPASTISPQIWRRRVCFLAQRPTMLPGTVAQNMEAGYGVSLAPRPPAGLERQARARMESLGLDPERIWQQDALTLSGGEAARVALCRAMTLEPQVLLCDEPTASLDLEHGQLLAKLLQQWLGRGGALLLVAHDSAPWSGLELTRVEVAGGGT